jgi:hypothetical protein
MSWLEILGFVTALLLTLKTVYNLSHFVYTTFLGRLLGHGLVINKCGPWAGNLNILKNMQLIVLIHDAFTLQWSREQQTESENPMLVWYVIFPRGIYYSTRHIFTYTCYFHFPFKLAAEGLNVVLISRTQAKLDMVASEIS